MIVGGFLCILVGLVVVISQLSEILHTLKTIKVTQEIEYEDTQRGQSDNQ